MLAERGLFFVFGSLCVCVCMFILLQCSQRNGMSSINVTHGDWLGLLGSCNHCLLQIRRIILFSLSVASMWRLLLGQLSFLKFEPSGLTHVFRFIVYVDLLRSTLCLDHCVQGLTSAYLQPVYICCWLPCDPNSHRQLWVHLFPPCINITHTTSRPPVIGHCPPMPIGKQIHSPAGNFTPWIFLLLKCILSQ